MPGPAVLVRPVRLPGDAVSPARRWPRDCDGPEARDAIPLPARAAAGEPRAQAALDRHADRLARGLAR